MACGCAGAALVAAGCGLTNTKTEVTTVTVTRTVTHTVTTTAAPAPSSAAGACNASDLTGTFAVLAGSAGAGNIVYTLHLTNASQQSCFLSGIPDVQLLDANGKALPTKPVPAQAGAQTAAKAILAPGASASSQARFSPDVPGVGESGNPCEPKASTLRVTVGNGTLDVKIDPPTSVCSHGSLQLSNYTTAD
jgi:hypothetical protein